MSAGCRIQCIETLQETVVGSLRIAIAAELDRQIVDQRVVWDGAEPDRGEPLGMRVPVPIGGKVVEASRSLGLMSADRPAVSPARAPLGEHRGFPGAWRAGKERDGSER